MELLVFGGTSEGRELVEWLDARESCQVVACTATSYGAQLLAGSARVTTVEGPLSAQEKRDLMEAHRFVCIVDATHPYAQHISRSVEELGRAYDIDVLRVVREEGPVSVGKHVANAYEAAAYLALTTGPILLTTGSRDLAAFTSVIPSFEERLYVRVLPLASSLERVAALGVPTSHVIALQGPFSASFNEALIREFHIEHLVTKQSGSAGGFGEKAAAAEACGIELVVIERPLEEHGLSLAATKRCLEERYGL